MPTISELTDLGTIQTGDDIAVTRSGSTSKAQVADMATQTSSAVAITGGTVTGVTDITIADGGTGSSTAGSAGSMGSSGDTVTSATSIAGGGWAVTG